MESLTPPIYVLLYIYLDNMSIKLLNNGHYIKVKTLYLRVLKLARKLLYRLVYMTQFKILEGYEDERF
ncbi:hypothetical protein LPAF129_13520 [Ligilactobacillus pabuli]|uniref:Uncharacterized protein n=1 Tax=Ligilactobacillus pabuli TaxID=2886039 RepID=A0ABQ5JHW4_9LACO|nr:hypothetical protein LPAF129_13520 [Ligilactobacillus pabuli]